MKKLKLPLHYQIFIGLLLGGVFGLIYPVNYNTIVLKYSSVGKERTINLEKYDSIKISNFDSQTNIYSARIFKKNELKKIIKYFKSLSENQDVSDITLSYYLNSHIRNVFPKITEIKRKESLATLFKPAGSIFIRLLLLLAIPLVLTTLIVGSASLKDIKTVGKLGVKTLFLYLITTAIAIIIGIWLANVIQPGSKLSAESKENISVDAGDFGINIKQNIDFSISEFAIDSVPRNIFEALTNADMLQIVFFALFFGISLILIDKTKAQIITDFLDSVSEVLIKMVDLVMKFAPIGVFALMASTISEFGISIISTLFWYIFTVLLGLVIHTILVYSGFLKAFSKYPVKEFFKKVRNAQTIAFSTSSSAATLPVTMETAERDLGLPRQITSFVLPLGATVNMDGTALLQGVATIFIAQFYNIDLNLMQQLTIVLMGILASIGTAPVPGVGIVMLIGILQSVGLPVEGIGLILGVDRILDMSRTVTNITGDLVVATIVSKDYKISD
jgi:Na+/H+-dicarboxylate symporter